MYTDSCQIILSFAVVGVDGLNTRWLKRGLAGHPGQSPRPGSSNA